MRDLQPKGAIIDLMADERIDADALETRVAARAAEIAPRLSPRRRTVILGHNKNIPFFVDLFATWRAGGCVARLNPGLTATERRSAAELVTPVLGFDDEGEAPDLTHPGEDPEGQTPPALILLTSGSTGAPKAVALSAEAVAARLAANVREIGAETLARTLNILPTHFGHGLIGGCLTALQAGGDLYLMTGAGPMGAARIGATLDQHRISFMTSTPGFWKLAMRAGPRPAEGTLARLHIGSTPLTEELWREIGDWVGAPVWNMYGMTEAANWIAGAADPRPGHVGAPWGGGAAVLADGAVKASGAGEILIRSDMLMSHYHRRPDLTEAAFHDGWFRTGDLGEVDAAGAIHLTGRLKFLIDIDGIKISPEEVDGVFETHPDVREACAFALSDPAAGERVGIAVTGAEEIDLAALRAWAAERLRPEARPAKIFVLPALPIDDRGKTNRNTARDWALKSAEA